MICCGDAFLLGGSKSTRPPLTMSRMPVPGHLGHFRSPVMPSPRRAPLHVPFDLHYGSFREQLSTRFFYLATSVSCRVDSLFIPVEITIVEFSFEQGVIRNYHKILEQNSIPKGLSYDCALQMHKHRIDAEAHSQQKGNYGADTFRDILDFFGQFPMIMFCEDRKLEQNVSVVNSFRQQFMKQQGGEAASVRIYGLQQLADHFVAHSGSPLSKASVGHLLQKAFFDSYLHHNCHYHNVLQSNLCTLDEAHKVAYAFLFAMSIVHQLELDRQIPNYQEMVPFLKKIALRFSK